MLQHLNRLALFLTALSFCATTFAQATAPAEPAEVDLVAALGSVRWQAAPPTMDMVKGKSSIVVIYATWCPKCNEWSPGLLQELKEAAVESPVTVFAINADETSPGASYAIERGLVGPNIVHGSDSKIDERLGFTSELFNFVAFNAEGKPIERGYMGSRVQTPAGVKFSIGHKVATGAYPGEFAILSKEMSPQLKQMLWPVELGQAINDKSLMKMRGQLPAAEHDDFNGAIRQYLDKHLANCEAGSQGEVPQQIEAHASAKLLAERFATTKQGKKAKTIVAKFDEDPQFKKETSAAIAYQKALASATPAAQKRALVKVANRFDGTHYGKVASEQAGVVAQ